MQRPHIDYANVTGRRPGSFLRVAGRVLPGIRRVQEQAAPYARAWHESNNQAVAGSGRLWVALGDSMTLGMGADAYDQGWVGQLAQRMRDAGDPVRVLNLAASGARVCDVLDQQLPALDTLGVQPDLVTVLIGSNDLLGRRHRPALPDRFSRLLDRLPERSIVGNLPNPTRTVAELNAILGSRVAVGRLALADMRHITSWRGKLATDYFHPNNSGHAMIADQFEQAMRTGSVR